MLRDNGQGRKKCYHPLMMISDHSRNAYRAQSARMRFPYNEIADTSWICIRDHEADKATKNRAKQLNT